MIPFLLYYSSGFETGDGSEFPTVSGNVTWSNAVIPDGYGKYSLYVVHNGSSKNYLLGFNSTVPRQWTTLKVRIHSVPASGYAYLVHFETGSGLAIQSTGKLAVINNSGSILVQGTTTLSLDTWYTVSFTNYDSNVGSAYCEIRLSGVVDGVSTNPISGGITSNQDVYVGDNGNAERTIPPACSYYLDDLVVGATQFLPGDYSIIKLGPKSNGYYSEWTGDATTNTQTNDGDTTYITCPGSTKSVTCLVNTPCDAGYDLPSTYKLIGMFFNYACRDSSSSGTSKISLLVRNAGIDYLAGPVNFVHTGSYVGRSTMFPKNTNTNLPWSFDDLDSLEFGLQSGTVASEYTYFRCTQMAMHAIVGYVISSTSVVQLAGLETGDLTEFVSVSGGNVTASNSVVHSGSYSLRVSATGTTTGYAQLCVCTHRGLVVDVPQYHDATGIDFYGIRTVFINFYFYPDTLPASSEDIFFRFNLSGNYLVARVTSAGNIKLYNGTTYLATSSEVLSPGTWYNLGFCMTTTLPATATVYTMQINGETSLTGSTTFGNLVPDRFFFGRVVNTSSQTVLFYYDDIIVNTDDFQPLPYGIQAIFPNAFGSTLPTQWLANSGTVPESLDEVPPDNETTYAYPDHSVGDGAMCALKFPSVSELPDIVDGLKAVKVHCLGHAGTSSSRIMVGFYVPGKWLWMSVEDIGATYTAGGVRTNLFGEDMGDCWRTWKKSRLDQLEVGLVALEVPVAPLRETQVSVHLLAGYPLDAPVVAYQFGG